MDRCNRFISLDGTTPIGKIVSHEKAQVCAICCNVFCPRYSSPDIAAMTDLLDEYSHLFKNNHKT